MKRTRTIVGAALIALLLYSGAACAQPISQPEAQKITVKQLAAQVTALQSTVTSLQTTITSLQNQLSSKNAQNAFALGKFMTADADGNIGIGTMTPLRFVSLAGDLPRNLGMDPNPVSGGVGNLLMINAGASAVGSTDLQGGDLVLAAGTGTGLGGSGNARIQTAGGEDSSSATSNTLVDREIVVGKAKQLTKSTGNLSSASLILTPLTGDQSAAGRIHYAIRATDGGSQVVSEEGVILYAEIAHVFSCSVPANEKVSAGSGLVNSGCNSFVGGQPGVSIVDNVSFISPASTVVNEVYFKVENLSGTPITLAP